MLQPFVEQVLDLGVDYGADGGPEWSNTITEAGGGYERVNINWSQPKGRWNLGDRTGENCLTRDQHDYLYRFWMARRGSGIGFRYKDWNDFELIDEVIGTGDGTTTAFQITRGYGSFERTIKKIADDPEPIVRVDGIYRPYTLDFNTGLITFTTAPSTGKEITVSCEFHVPVRFEQDAWPGRFYAADLQTGQRYYELGTLGVREIRV